MIFLVICLLKLEVSASTFIRYGFNFLHLIATTKKSIYCFIFFVLNLLNSSIMRLPNYIINPQSFPLKKKYSMIKLQIIYGTIIDILEKKIRLSNSLIFKIYFDVSSFLYKKQ